MAGCGTLWEAFVLTADSIKSQQACMSFRALQGTTHVPLRRECICAAVGLDPQVGLMPHGHADWACLVCLQQLSGKCRALQGTRQSKNASGAAVGLNPQDAVTAQGHAD